MKRIYIKVQKKVPLEPLEKIDPKIRDLVASLRGGRKYTTKQTWKPIGWWCWLCGHVEIWEPSYKEQVKQTLE